MHQLTAWRIKQKQTRKELAAILGVAESSVWRWEMGKIRPTWPMMEKIIDITRGKVRADAFHTNQKSGKESR